jgi:hypothetical protein
MPKTGLVCLVLAVSCLTLNAAQPEKAAVKKLAQEMGDATVKGDYAKLIEHTHDGVVKALGGREAAIKGVETAMKLMKNQGIALKSFTVGEPGEFSTEGANTFVVVPTSIEMTMPGGNALTKSYVLGISSDGGKSWKFADGAGMDNKEKRDLILPKLPANLALPPKQNPEIFKDKLP